MADDADKTTEQGLDLDLRGGVTLLDEFSSYDITLGHTSFDDVKIAYLDKGEGPVVLLLHGYASSVLSNWISPRIVEALVDAGFRVVAPDLRGHGFSDKPHDAEAYLDHAMVRDCQSLLDELQVESTHVVGYSMGATIAMWFALKDPRADRLVIAGHGDTITLDKWTGADHVAAGLLASSEEGLDETQIGYRRFIEKERGDFVAMARVAETDQGIPQEMLAQVDEATLILTGIDDDMVGPVDGLANALANARVVRPPGDHLTAPALPEFTEALVAFLTSD